MTWNETRLKHLCVDSGTYGLNIAADYYSAAGTRLVRTSDIAADGSLKDPESGVYVDVPIEVRHRLLPGDILLSRSGTLGRSFLVPEHAQGHTFAGFLIRFRPKAGVEPRFLNYATQSAGFQGTVHSEAVASTIQNFNAERYANVSMRIPASEEQRRIADFLDAETARIDRLVELRNRTLTLLAERMINRLDAAVRGVAAPGPKRVADYSPLGEVPLDWRQGRLRSVDCDVQTGPFGSQLHAEDYVDAEWPVVNPANITPAGLVADNQVTVSDRVRARLERHILRTGDVVFGRRGELGRAGIVTEAQAGWVCGTGSLRVRFAKGAFHPGYLRRYLAIPAVRHYFQLQAIGSTMPNLNSSILLNMPLLLPSLSEQAEIAQRCAEIESLAAKHRLLVERQVRLFLERRQALITAAVTGQFDVTTASGRNVTEGVSA
ncbi:restriction endonuclease subunit S [Streptomyces longwoodensis]|uniref:restriction endonuclease subunit S n=1 Tax=Streptomyces longwoodensis TaxID=68231 RepID=UPI00340995A4